MTWTIDRAQLETAPFASLRPVEVLYDFEGPQIFIAYDGGRPLFVYVSDIDEQQQYLRFLVTPISKRIIDYLKEGELSLCDALRLPWLHAVDQAFDGTVLATWYLDDGLDAVPDGYKPVEGTLLSPELEAARMNAPILAPDVPNETQEVDITFAVSNAYMTVVTQKHAYPEATFRYSSHWTQLEEVIVAPILELPEDAQLNEWVPGDEAARPPYFH
ncbi:hypothetical protein WJH60_30710 [Burkholderia orbicola]|uniref:hypothetical protein n=1 Tax=Burkholderia cepacia complex TaxID=87882 RepID=UPI00158B41AD|nr:hypothetical protein [Burkholderia cenocepacia]MBR7956432.1 hypothetical protein [Burkholderia cenocepacia]